MPDITDIIRLQQEYPVIGSNEPDALQLGRFVDRTQNAITGRLCYGGERNAIIFGPNGCGKSMRILVANLLSSTGKSFFVIDPKGELAAITAEYRRTVSRVIIINPFGMFTSLPGYADLESSGYNPLAALDPDKPSFNADAALLAEAMVTVEGKDPHWSNSARALLAALIMFVVLEARGRLSADVIELAGVPARKDELPTIARVRQLLCMPSAEPSALNSHKGQGIPRLALAMMKTGIPGLSNKAAQFTDWTNEIRSVVSTAKIQTEPFDDDEISADLAKDGVRFKQLKERPTTVYLMLHPEMMERHSKWLRLVLTSAIQSIMRPRADGEPRVMFMMDEFAALGHLKIIETVWALVRGYGIQLLPIFQDLGQLKQIYEQRWETFVGMAGIITSFAPNDLTTAEWLSERAGETTREVISRNENSSTSSGNSVSTPAGLLPTGNGSNGANFGTSYGSSSNSSPTKVRLAHRHSLFGMAAGATVNFVAGLSDMVPGFAPLWVNIDRCAARGRKNPYYIG